MNASDSIFTGGKYHVVLFLEQVILSEIFHFPHASKQTNVDRRGRHTYLTIFVNVYYGTRKRSFWSCKLNRKEYQNIDSKIWKKLRVELTTSRNYDVGISISLFFPLIIRLFTLKTNILKHKKFKWLHPASILYPVFVALVDLYRCKLYVS